MSNTASHNTLSDSVIAISVNDRQREVPAGCTLEGLLRHIGADGKRVAIAVNRDVIPRSSFSSHQLIAGDRVEILQAVGGG